VSEPLPRTVSTPLRRGRGQVQFGTAAGRAVVVDGLTTEEVRALEQLDGTHGLPATLTPAAPRDVLALLHRHGLVVTRDDDVALPLALRAVLAGDAQAGAVLDGVDGYAALSRRRGARVLVCSRGALPASLVALLRRAGIGEVVLGQAAADDWGHEGEASAPTPGAARGGDGAAPALVVLPAGHAVDSTLAEPWLRRGVPVLPVVLHGVEAVVGPLVVAGGPCLHCLDLTRSDLDPAWPALLGQLTRQSVGSDVEVSGETALVALAAAMATMVALAFVDGRALPVGRSLEAALPWPAVRQREWPVHPRCHCDAASSRGSAGEHTATDLSA
jgi:hypothetical protein